MAATVPWCLSGSDGRGAARVEDKGAPGRRVVIRFDPHLFLVYRQRRHHSVGMIHIGVEERPLPVVAQPLAAQITSEYSSDRW